MKILSNLLIGLSLTYSVSALAATYYVSSSGNDSNNGLSPSSPWKTPSKVSAQVLTPGTKVYFKGGEIFPGKIELTSVDAGNAGNPVTIGSYGSGSAIITSSVNQSGLSVYNTAGLIVEDLIFKGPGGSTTAAGMDFYSDTPGNLKHQFIKVSNVEVSDYMVGIQFGSYTASSPETGFKDVLVEDSKVHHNIDKGIQTYGYWDGTQTYLAHSDVTFRRIEAYENAGIPNHPKHTGNGIMMGQTESGLIEYCIAHNNGANNSSNSEGPIGIWAWDSIKIFIQHNFSHHNKTGSSKDGGGFDLDGGVKMSVMQYNYSLENDGAGYLVYQFSNSNPGSDNIVRYNISENDGVKNNYAGIMVGGNSPNDKMENVEIYNNTVYNSQHASGIAFQLLNTNVENINVRNNIFATSGNVDLIKSPVTSKIKFQGNNYYSYTGSLNIRWGSTNHSTIASWQAQTPAIEKVNGVNVGTWSHPKFKNPGARIMFTNPNLIPTLDSYELLSGGPMIDLGLDLWTSFGVDPGQIDFQGNSNYNGSAPDRGAVEY